jgi:hypothetical protein
LKAVREKNEIACKGKSIEKTQQISQQNPENKKGME